MIAVKTRQPTPDNIAPNLLLNTKKTTTPKRDATSNAKKQNNNTLKK